MAAAIETKELDKLLTLNQQQLEEEANATNLTKAQLKSNERTFLAEREILKGELAQAPVEEATRIRAAIKTNDDNILRNESEQEALEIKRRLIGLLKKGFDSTNSAASSTETRSSRAESPRPHDREEESRTPKRLIGKMPEYSLKEDFDLFLLKFRTYTSLNQISDRNQTKLLLDTCLSDQAKQRCGYITALDEPYLSQTFAEYTDCLKLRFHPKAKSLLFKSGYDLIKQRNDQNVQDYMALKFSAFLKGYQSWPFEFFARTMTEKLFNEDLKTEVIRQLGDLESSKETNILNQQKLFSEIMQIANIALDLCRRTSNLSPDQMNRNGLNIETGGGEETTSSSTTSSSNVAQLNEEAMYESGEYGDWFDDGEAESCWEVEQEVVDEHPLSQQETDYCFKLETEQESNLWERQPSEDELAQINQSPTKKLCFNCSSQNHLVAQCPTRLQIVQQRTQRIFAQSGRQQQQQPRAGGYQGSREPARGYAGRRPRGRGRPGFSGGRQGSGFRGNYSSAPQGYTSSPRGYASAAQARYSHTNPYNPSQSPAVIGPNPQTFFR